MSLFPTPFGEISYTDTGQQALPVLVMLHGFLMDSSMFDAQKEVFAEDYRIITIDSYGHGKSDAGTADFTYWDIAHQVNHLLESLGVVQATILGMSQGGFTALRLALSAPERVQGLILVGSEAARMPEAVQHEMRELFTNWDEVRTNSEVISSLAGQIIGSRSFWDKWPGLWSEIPQDQLTRAARCLIERDDITQQLDQMQAKTLLIVGENDTAAPPNVQKSLARAIPHCLGVTVVPDAAHAANMTHPDLVNEAIGSYLRRS